MNKIIMAILALGLFYSTQANASKFKDDLPLIDRLAIQSDNALTVHLPQDQKRDIICMALNVYHEAYTAPVDEQIRVGWATRNRLSHDNFKKNICEIIYQYQGFNPQFSWITMRNKNPTNEKEWAKSLAVARYVLRAKQIYDPTNGAVFFARKDINFQKGWARTTRLVLISPYHKYYCLAG